MKNSQTIITIIFGFAIALLFILVANKKTPETAMQRAPQSQHIVYSDSTMQVFPIAYVNFDSLMQNYEYYKILEKQYETLVKKEENILQQKAAAFEKEVSEFQYNAQNGLITSRDAETKQMELQKKQEQLVQQQQAKGAELAHHEQLLMVQLLDSVQATIKTYNADMRFKMILNSAAILDASESFNITQDVLSLMNERYTKSSKK